MTDTRPVYLIPRSEYEGNYCVEGEGLPCGTTLANGCKIRAKIEYVFTGPNGETIYKEQILSENWKEEWTEEFAAGDCDCCAKRYNVYNVQERIKNYLEEKYPGNNHPQTMDELNKVWYEILDIEVNSTEIFSKDWKREWSCKNMTDWERMGSDPPYSSLDSKTEMEKYLDKLYPNNNQPQTVSELIKVMNEKNEEKNKYSSDSDNDEDYSKISNKLLPRRVPFLDIKELN